MKASFLHFSSVTKKGFWNNTSNVLQLKTIRDTLVQLEWNKLGLLQAAAGEKYLGELRGLSVRGVRKDLLVNWTCVR